VLLWALSSKTWAPSLPSPLKTWEMSKLYLLKPFEKRGELDQGILRFTWYSLILVATRTDIKRMLRIVTALDTSIASVSSIKVIPLRYADAKDTATLITALFPAQTGIQAGGPGGAMGRGNLISMLAGGGFGGRGGPTAAGGRGGTSGGGSAATAAKVVAVGDERSNSLVISAPADLVATIETMVKEIDQEVTDITELRVFRLANADPAETADQLATLFPDPTASTGGNQNNVPFFMRGPFGGGRGRTSAGSTGSDRTKQMGKVLTVPDPRTSSIIAPYRSLVTSPSHGPPHFLM